MKKAILLVALVTLCVPAFAQRKHKSEDVKSVEQRPPSDARSFMELFGKLERDLGMGVEKKDEEALDALVSTEFIERDAADPERAISRIEWMQRLGDYKLDPHEIKAMTIRAFLGNAIVSFVQKERALSGVSSQAVEYLIVDVWVVNHGKWQVASRFKSAAVPGINSKHI